LIWSSIEPHDRLTWWLEIFPALAALVILFATYRRFEFTTLTYTLIALHMCVLFVGGHYTYARVPLFDWLKPIFRLATATTTIALAISCKALFPPSSRAKCFFACKS
jgi:putative membrane protein